MSRLQAAHNEMPHGLNENKRTPRELTGPGIVSGRREAVMGGHWQRDRHLEILDTGRPRRATHDKKHVKFMDMVPLTQDPLKSKWLYICLFVCLFCLTKGIISKQKQKHECD